MRERGSSWLSKVRAPELTNQDLVWLVKAARANWNGVQAQDWIADEPSGRVQIWRINGKAEGLVLTRVNRLPGGLELEVIGLAGRGIFPAQAWPIWADLLEVKKFFGCRWVTSHNIHPRLNRLYERLLGVPPHSTLFVMED